MRRGPGRPKGSFKVRTIAALERDEKLDEEGGLNVS